MLALGILHASQIVHRDLKPANLILSKDLKTIKVADFSASRVLESGEAALDTVAGTLNYSAPEVLRGKPYGESCDLWSLGCVVYEICTLQKAFKIANTTKILATINKQEIPIISDDRDPGLVMLCNRLLNPDPARRPSAASLCKHPRLKPYIIHHMCDVVPIQRRLKIADTQHRDHITSN
jgi:serine/threonine protein kinase